MIKGDASRNPPEFRDHLPRRPAHDNRGCTAEHLPAMTLPPPDPAFHWSHEPWGFALRCQRLGEDTQHLFTSKQLELPNPASWLAAVASVGASPDRLMRVKQVHGNTVRVLRRGQLPEGAAALRPDGDAIVSNQPGLVLAVMVADCVPILMVDRATGAAAAVHAGWRGTCARVAPTAADVMRREFATHPDDLIAAIGPSVGPDDYEVGETLIASFREAGHDAREIDRWFIRSTTKPHLDLWKANRDQLIAAGVKADRIFTCGLSTVAHPEVFDSYRVAGDKAGRMAALVVVPPPA
jgi:YfiH family protein